VECRNIVDTHNTVSGPSVPTSVQVVLEKQSEILWPEAHCFGHDIHAGALNVSTLRMRFKQKD